MGTETRTSWRVPSMYSDQGNYMTSVSSPSPPFKSLQKEWNLFLSPSPQKKEEDAYGLTLEGHMGMIKSCLFLLGGSWGFHKRKTHIIIYAPLQNLDCCLNSIASSIHCWFLDFERHYFSPEYRSFTVRHDLWTRTVNIVPKGNNGRIQHTLSFFLFRF